MNLVDRQLLEISVEFTAIDEEFDRYEYLLELADNLPPVQRGCEPWSIWFRDATPKYGCTPMVGEGISTLLRTAMAP